MLSKKSSLHDVVSLAYLVLYVRYVRYFRIFLEQPRRFIIGHLIKGLNPEESVLYIYEDRNYQCPEGTGSKCTMEICLFDEFSIPVPVEHHSLALSDLVTLHLIKPLGVVCGA